MRDAALDMVVVTFPARVATLNFRATLWVVVDWGNLVAFKIPQIFCKFFLSSPRLLIIHKRARFMFCAPVFNSLR